MSGKKKEPLVLINITDDKFQGYIVSFPKDEDEAETSPIFVGTGRELDLVIRGWMAGAKAEDW